jgi:CubicO group peptidase (beta-lactamase class C family)
MTNMPELTEVSSVAEKAVADGRIPGVVVARSRGQIVHRSAHGVLDLETGYPLRPDTIVWLASLAKVIGAAALLTLADDGRVGVEDPVSAYIPEFGFPGRVRVLRPGSPSPVSAPFGPPPDPLPEYDIVPAQRELTLLDLLTHTGGLQSIFLWNPEYLSVAVVEDPAAAGESLPAGTFGWDGVGTRRFWVSPSGGWSLFYYVPDTAAQREIEAAVTSVLG